MPERVVSIATDEDVARALSGVRFEGQWHAVSARRGRLITAIGGAFETDTPGVWLGFMNVDPRERSIIAYRYARRMLKAAADGGAEVVRTTCDTRIPRAREFMERLGFEETEDKLGEEVIWAWRP